MVAQQSIVQNLVNDSYQQNEMSENQIRFLRQQGLQNNSHIQDSVNFPQYSQNQGNISVQQN